MTLSEDLSSESGLPDFMFMEIYKCLISKNKTLFPSFAVDLTLFRLNTTTVYKCSYIYFDLSDLPLYIKTKVILEVVIWCSTVTGHSTDDARITFLFVGTSSARGQRAEIPPRQQHANKQPG